MARLLSKVILLIPHFSSNIINIMTQVRRGMESMGLHIPKPADILFPISLEPPRFFTDISFLLLSSISMVFWEHRDAPPSNYECSPSAPGVPRFCPQWVFNCSSCIYRVIAIWSDLEYCDAGVWQGKNLKSCLGPTMAHYSAKSYCQG